MRKDTYGKLALFIICSVLVLSACKDNSSGASAGGEQDGAVSVANQDNAATAGNVPTLIAECDEYLSAMQACKTAQIDIQEAQKLDRALSDLRSVMAQIEDKEQLRQMCQQGLDQMDEQKRAIGCLPN